jgi:cytidine deaminase
VPNTGEDSRPELVVALVGAAGTRLGDLSNALKKELEKFGYDTVDVRLSDLLVNFAEWVDQKEKGEVGRLPHLQDMGNRFRNRLGDGAALARAGIAAIREKRLDLTKSPDRPAPARAYIVHQLKHPEEVSLLRQVYGTSFVLVAGHAPHEQRVSELARRAAENALKPGKEGDFRGPAEAVIIADEKQEDELGQNTRDTYPKADFFANLGLPLGETEVGRFVELLFGHPFRTPTPDEYAMYQASAAALGSSDFSRQVGAVIVSIIRDVRAYPKSADIIAVGMNEVPRGGGGYYWDGISPDCRDQALLQRGEDRAESIKVGALAEMLQKIRNKEWLRETIAAADHTDLARQLLPDLKRTQFMDIGEFSRPVHAETAALIDGARRGVAVDGLSMYVTTFPCHNCVKHIIAAGLRRVIYLEPYPKSRAEFLYREEIDWESKDGKEQEGKVVFAAFTGIAPRQYRQLYSMSARGAKQGRLLKDWEASRRQLPPLYVLRNASLAYLAEERQELEKLNPDIYRWDKNAVCPT